MRHKTLYNLLFLFIVPFSVYGQRIVYDYDASSNRVARHAEETATEAPGERPGNSLPPAAGAQAKEASQSLSYDSQTDILNIASCVEHSSTGDAVIYTSGGIKVARFTVKPSGSRRSLSSLPAGTYVVRLSRGGNAEEIKITKGK